MWAKNGSVTLVKGSNVVVGKNTTFTTLAEIGDGFISPDGGIYEIVNIVSDTQLTLGRGYDGLIGGNLPYLIMPLRGGFNQATLEFQKILKEFGSILAQGLTIKPNASGSLEDRSLFDLEQTGFTYLSITDNKFYVKLSNKEAHWSVGMSVGAGAKGAKGDRGEQGPPVPVAQELGDDPRLAVSQKLLKDSMLSMEQSNSEAVAEAERLNDLSQQAASSAAESESNASASAESANSSALSADQSASESASSAELAAEKATETELNATRAEAASDAAFVNADVYPDVATGLASVADGEQFQVLSDKGLEYKRYRKDSATEATEVGEGFPTPKQVERAVQQAENAADRVEVALDNKVDTSSITQTTGQSTTEIMSQKAVTDIFLQYNDSQTGLRWNQETDIYQVLGSINRTRIQERMRRCVLNADGTVNYYLDQHDSTKKEDGTPAILDGTDGNVMVEIPKFYYKQHLVGDQHEWWISATPAAGYKVHEAFLKDGDTEVDYVYWAAYRPTTLDDKLMSVSGVAPTVSKNIATFRAEARANGAGWNLPNFHILSAIRLLYLLEYCTFNSQAVLGNGNHTGANYTRTTGVSNILGNESSSPAITGWMSYRGIEDFYASSWQFIEGCGLNNGVFRSTNVEADYNNTLSGDSYVDGVSVPEFSATYIKKITSDFLPQLGGGSSTTFTCDGAWSNPSGLRVYLFGGHANLGDIGGVFCASLHRSFSSVYVSLAAGLSFR